MKNSTRILLTLVLSATLFAANGYSAEEKSKQTTVTDADVQAAWQRRIAEIDLGDHLPLSEVSKHLGERFREVNFVVPVSARDESVPRLVLRNVTLGEILKAIELASEGRIRGGVPSEPQGVDAAGLPIRTTMDNSQGNLVAFSVGPLAGTPSAARQSPVVCRVFSLAPYLAYRSEKDSQLAIKEIYDALEVAWEMLKKYERDVRAPELTIHQGTKLLIAVGREKELTVIEQVIKQLQGPSPSKKIATSPENEPKPKAADGDASPAPATKP